MDAEILSLLEPKSVRLDNVGHGKATLTKDDVNCACAGAHEAGLSLLLAKISEDRATQDKAFYSLYTRVIDLAVEKNWKSKKGTDRIRSLVQLAVFEHTSTPRCKSCHGTKFNRRMQPCKQCAGTGIYKIKDSQRARALGVDQSTWKRVWATRYADVIGLISEYEYLAMRKIVKSLLT